MAKVVVEVDGMVFEIDAKDTRDIEEMMDNILDCFLHMIVDNLFSKIDFKDGVPRFLR